MATASSIPVKVKYPFLPEAREEYRSRGFTLKDFDDPSLKPIVDRAVERVINAIKFGENLDPWKISEDDFTEIASFPLAVVLVAKVGDNFLKKRFALTEVSMIQKRLMNEREEDRVKLILEIAKNFFKMDVEYGELPPPYTFTIGLVDYLKLASKFNDPAWKLVNRIVVKGRVYVEDRELIRLIRDKLEEHVIKNIEEAEKEVTVLPKTLEEAVRIIKNNLPERKIEEESIQMVSRPEAWPPCIKTIYAKLVSGESVSHFANFMMASFLLNTGVSIEDIVSIYSQRSDFNVRIARYQVEHIAGMRGSRTKYITPSCSKIRTNGLCIENGRLCGNVKNPMTYYKRRLREVIKSDKDKDEFPGKRREASS
ncbi:MAG: DNA primase large subunit PriL [Aigarchaeota archaeon]|nr:DNA primase large subunit PriL [Candidatus Geocrenenecus dongiae]